MRKFLMRKLLPDRRRSWTKEVVINGTTIILGVGEYEDGSPGEVWVDVSKEGTFLRGIMDAWSRTTSIALQCGADIDMIVHSIEGLIFPPNGVVEGTDSSIGECTSVVDWIAQELREKYMNRECTTQLGEGDPLPQGKTVPRHISKNVWA